MTKSAIPYFSQFPPDFREEVTDKIVSAAQKGRNLQLVGPKGSGKSLFFRYFSSNPRILGTFMIYRLDFNLLAERSVSAVSQLVLTEMKKWEISRQGSGKNLIVLADSFENIVDLLDDSLARVFKGVVDRFRGFISFVFSVERPIESGNPFWGEVFLMPPLSLSDFDWFWQGLGGKKKDKNKIYHAAGGNMALIKRLSEIASSPGNLDAVIENPRLNPHLLYQLELMKEGSRGKKNYFSVPIYETFLKGQQFGKELTALEYKAFCFLEKNQGKIVMRDDLIEVVWGEHASREVTDHALDQLMHRLKPKLAEKNLKLETIRGRGHRLSVID